jgi:phosphoserine phosphatase RsbU/P
MPKSIFSQIFQPRSLQQRTAVFILIPTFLLLLAIGSVQFIMVRDMLLEQWGETAIARLQRAAHHIDMRLNRPKQLLQLLQETAATDADKKIHNFIIARLRQMEGVVDVQPEWRENQSSHGKTADTAGETPVPGHHHDAGSSPFKPPVYDFSSKNKIVSLTADFNNAEGRNIGRVEVLFSLDSLIALPEEMPWWSNYKAYVVDMQGTVLVDAALSENVPKVQGKSVFGDAGTLEAKTLAALQARVAGTVFGPGRPPTEISGFYRLEEAPWTLILIAPGKEVLRPIIRFNILYVALSIACMILILIFIRSMTSRITSAIREVSRAAGALAKGNFGEPLLITSRDEVGELTRNFNAMTSRLEQGAHLQKSIEIAREVQQNFLPRRGVDKPGLTVSGVSVYCDETGGDFFDFIEFPNNPAQIGIVVGDVVGHGIGAALLMATVRALLRSRLGQSGSLAEIITDVNRLLCLDTIQTGNFSSLFYLTIDTDRGEAQWVRAGHDPAILYYPGLQRFEELKGEGLVLGVDAGYPYSSGMLPLGREEVIILIGSDGAWEVGNSEGERFGKQRIRDLLKTRHGLPPEMMLQAITAEIEQFRNLQPQADDITLVAIRINGRPSN